MNIFIKSSGKLSAGGARRVVALVSILTLVAQMFALSANAQRQQSVQATRLSEEQRILHVLNRLGFGARPGDVERVRAMGLDNYIRQQLHPESIADALAEAKVSHLPALKMTTTEIFARYPPPGALLRRMERRGELPPELAAARDARKQGNAANDADDALKAGDGKAPVDGKAMTMTDEETAAGKDAAGEKNNAENGKNNKAYRRAVRDYYLKNNLQQPQRLIAELQASRILRAVYSERQLQEVLVDFWANHFNVFMGKGADRWLLVAYDRDTIRPNTLGKFQDLLVATAQSPAMLFYLDNFQSVSPNASGNNRTGGIERGLKRDMWLFDRMFRRRANNRRAPDANMGQQEETPKPQAQPKRMKRGINENYARELMELHTLGVDGGYTQKDVQEVARCFTGWTISNPRAFRTAALDGASERAGQFFFNPRLHDDGEKTVLGHKIPAGGGIRDGLMVLEILARHPSTAKFIATKLARRFVMDNPTPALVERTSAAFTKSGGDIRETLRALFSAPEFNSPASYRAKIKTPFELVVSSIRTLGGETTGAPAVHQWIARMGEPLYGFQAPTGYPDVAENWVNTGALLERLNFGLALASNRIPGTRVNLERFLPDATNGSAIDKARVMERFLGIIVQGDVSAQTKQTLLKQLDAALTAPSSSNVGMSTSADKMNAMDAGQRGGVGRRRQRQMAQTDLSIVSHPEVVKVVGLILGSPEFQRQ
ncbi:MAG TPA: DUF1800 domain-containing protein [Pyrinomonadaceae bacterium]